MASVIYSTTKAVEFQYVSSEGGSSYDGKVTILHIPRDGKFYDQPPVNYEIEDGKLKVALVGNNRFDVFSLVEKDAKSMTLKGKFGGYYYFTKK